MTVMRTRLRWPFSTAETLVWVFLTVVIEVLVMHFWVGPDPSWWMWFAVYLPVAVLVALGVGAVGLVRQHE